MGNIILVMFAILCILFAVGKLAFDNVLSTYNENQDKTIVTDENFNDIDLVSEILRHLEFETKDDMYSIYEKFIKNMKKGELKKLKKFLLIEKIKYKDIKYVIEIFYNKKNEKQKKEKSEKIIKLKEKINNFQL